MAGNLRQVVFGQQERLDQIVHVEQIANLPAVAIDGDRQVLLCSNEEVRDPTLIFGAVLMRPINTAHAENRRVDPIAACIVQNILIGGALRAAIRTMEAERVGLVDAV